MAAYYVLEVPARQERSVYLRITDEESKPKADPFSVQFGKTIQDRISEANEFYSNINPPDLGPQQQLINRQAYAGQL